MKKNSQMSSSLAVGILLVLPLLMMLSKPDESKEENK